MFAHSRVCVICSKAYRQGMLVSERQHRGAELQFFTSASLCVASPWLTSLGCKPCHTQRSLAAEARRARVKSAVLHCVRTGLTYVVWIVESTVSRHWVELKALSQGQSFTGVIPSWSTDTWWKGRELPVHLCVHLERSHLKANFLKLYSCDVKTDWVVSYWRGCLSETRCKWFAYGPADATATPSSLAPVKSEWFSFLMPAYPGCPGKRSLNRCSSSSGSSTSSSNSQDILIIGLILLKNTLLYMCTRPVCLMCV